MFLYQNGSLQHTQQLFKKSKKKKSKSEKMISFPFATRPPNIRIPLLWKIILLVVVLENIMIIVN